MSDIVERVARAICFSYGRDPEAPFIDHHGKSCDFPEWERWQGEARSAIKVMQEALTQGGGMSLDLAKLKEVIDAYDAGRKYTLGEFEALMEIVMPAARLVLAAQSAESVAEAARLDRIASLASPFLTPPRRPA